VGRQPILRRQNQACRASWSVGKAPHPKTEPTKRLCPSRPVPSLNPSVVLEGQGLHTPITTVKGDWRTSGRRDESSPYTPQSLQVLLTLLAECFAPFGHPTCAISVSRRVGLPSLRYTREHQATCSSSLTLEEAAKHDARLHSHKVRGSPQGSHLLRP